MHPALPRTFPLFAAFPLCQVSAVPAAPVPPPAALITNDAVVLGLLIAVLYFVMETS
ncbi:MAG: hypothetical protein ICV83_12180, partial [Cytophagales bacterium]|nr:hypothetical protein [Cytophagales bacterium]